MQASAHVDAGICGFHTDIEATSEDGMFVIFRATSDCAKMKRFIEALAERGPLNAYEELNPEGGSILLNTAKDGLGGCCAGCATPTAFFKAMQVAAGLALPKDVAIRIERG